MDFSSVIGTVRDTLGNVRGSLDLVSRVDPSQLLGQLGRDVVNPLFENIGLATGGSRTQSVLSAMRGRGDPLPSYQWYCELPPLSGLGEKNTLSWSFVEEATLPFAEYEQQNNYRAGGMLYYPGHRTLTSLSIKVFEDSRGSATEYFQTWQQLIKDPLTRKYNVPVFYKKPVRFTVFDVARRTSLFLTYTGCWPTQQDAFSLQSSSSERVNPTVTLSADDVYIQYGSYTQDAIPSLIDNALGSNTVSRFSDILKSVASQLSDPIRF